MSSAKPPQGKEPEALQSTRQMLDELDALMDRMLALPVNDLDDAAPESRANVHMPTVSATLTVLDAPAEEEAPPAREERRPPRENFPSYVTDPAPAPRQTVSDWSAPHRPQPKPLPPQPPLAQPLLTQSPQTTPEPGPEAVSEEFIPESIATMPLPIIWPDPPVKPLRLQRRSLASRCMVPLMWFNQGFDKSTILLGAPGRWLSSPPGRRLLGLIGLSLFGVAGLWLVKDWLGWTW